MITTSGKVMPISRLTSKGQTTIPKPVRDALKLKPGDRIQFNVDKDGIVRITAINKDISSLAGMFYDPNRKTVTIEEMNEGIAQAAAERYLRSK